MITYKKEMVEQFVPQDITCDICKKKYEFNTGQWEADEEIQEFIRISTIGGYGSIFGDEVTVEIDMCQHCFEKKLGEYLRFK